MHRIFRFVPNRLIGGVTFVATMLYLCSIPIQFGGRWPFKRIFNWPWSRCTSTTRSDFKQLYVEFILDLLDLMPWRCRSTYWQLIHECSPAFPVLGDPCCVLYASESHLFTVLPNLVHPSLLRPSPSSLPMHVPLHCYPWKSVLFLRHATQTTLLDSLDHSLAKRQSIVNFFVPNSVPTLLNL